MSLTCDIVSASLVVQMKDSAAPRGCTTVSVNREIAALLDRIVAKLSEKTGFRVGKADVLRSLVVAEAKRLKVK